VSTPAVVVGGLAAAAVLLNASSAHAFDFGSLDVEGMFANSGSAPVKVKSNNSEYEEMLKTIEKNQKKLKGQVLELPDAPPVVDTPPPPAPVPGTLSDDDGASAVAALKEQAAAAEAAEAKKREEEKRLYEERMARAERNREDKAARRRAEVERERAAKEAATKLAAEREADEAYQANLKAEADAKAKAAAEAKAEQAKSRAQRLEAEKQAQLAKAREERKTAKKQSGGGGGSPAGFLFGRVFGVAFFAGAALAARQALTKGAVAPDALVEELKGATEGLSTKQIAVAVGAVLAALLADGFLNLPLLNLVFPALAQIGGLATAGVLAARYTWGDASPEEDFEGVKKSVTTLID